VPQEGPGPFDLELDVVLTGLRSEPNLLDLHMVLLGIPGLPLLLFVLEFAVIHDPANRRLNIGRHFDQVEARIQSNLPCFIRGNDPQHLPFPIHYANRCYPDLLIQPVRRFDIRFPHVHKSKVTNRFARPSYCTNATAQLTFLSRKFPTVNNSVQIALISPLEGQIVRKPRDVVAGRKYVLSVTLVWKRLAA
jgi:hypothetical protein